MSIEIGKIINKILTDNSLACFPIVAPENSALPLIIYERSFDAEHTKDGRSLDTNNIDVYILSEDYKETITLSKQIEGLISAVKGTILDAFVIKSKLVAGAELYQDGVYIQKLTFSILTAF